MRLEEFLQELKAKAKKNALKKAEEVKIERVSRFDEYLWRSTGDIRKLPALHFYVEINGKYHNVVLTKHTGDGKYYMWCGDKWIRDAGFDEKYCYQWKNRNAVCHHMVAVIDHLLRNNDLSAVASYLGEEVEETSRLSSDEFEIGWEMKLPMLLYGVTGAGKSHSVLEFVKKVKEKEDVEFFQINMSSGLEDVDLLAKMIPDPESGKWTIRDGELWRAFKTATKKPVIILIEELTRSTKSARNLFLKAMDSVSGKYHLQNFVTGESVEVPVENIWWIATANIGYSDTEELDPALIRRFLITKFVDYDLEKEKQIVTEILEDEKEAEKIIEKIVKPIRKAYETGQIPYPIDTGTLKVFAVLKKKTGDLMKAAEMTFLYRIVDVDVSGKPSEEQVSLLKEIVREAMQDK